MHDGMIQIDRLTLKQQFRLIEIAHETGSCEIKEAALHLLRGIYARPFIASEDHGVQTPRATP